MRKGNPKITYQLCKYFLTNSILTILKSNRQMQNPKTSVNRTKYNIKIINKRGKKKEKSPKKGKKRINRKSKTNKKERKRTTMKRKRKRRRKKSRENGKEKKEL